MTERSQSKLKVPKFEGYRATAAKRLQTPEYKPDDEEELDMFAEEEDENDSESEG